MKRFLFLMFMCFSISLGAVNKDKILTTEQEQGEGKKTYLQGKCGFAEALGFTGFSTYFPFGWAEDISRPGERFKLKSKGVFVTIFQDILNRLGISETMSYNNGYTSFQDSYRALQQGQIDFFLGGYYDNTMFHSELTLIYPSLFQNPFVVVFLKGKEKQVRSFDDLSGLKGLVRQEELIYPLVYKKVPSTTQLIRVSGSKNAYLKLLKGEVDFLLTSFYANEAEMRRFKLIDRLSVSDRALFKADMFIFANRNSVCYEQLKDQISNILTTYKKEKFVEKKVKEGVDQWGILFQDEPELTVEKPAQSVKEETAVPDKLVPPMIMPI